MSFTEAAASFLGSRTAVNARGRIQYIAPRTFRDYEDYLRMLGAFFGPQRLDQIHAGHLRSYQIARNNGDGFLRRVGKHGDAAELVQTCAGPYKINKELNLLRRIMTMAQAWTPQLQAMYRPLQVEDTDIPKALSPQEQEHFLNTAASNPDWELVYWYSLVALHTTFSSDEMRTIRQGDLNIPQQILAVNRKHGKNKYRRRAVPITDGDCMYALEMLLKRSIDLMGRSPELHLFPIRAARGKYDGTVPMSPTGLRKDFREVREAAGLAWFCINGWRHTAITRMAEAGVPIAVIMSRAGHTTAKMSAHYTHISEQSERMELQRMNRKQPGRVTQINAAHQWRNFA